MVQSIPNVIVFGETGSGKSSVVNMLEGSSDEAEVSSSAKPVTFASAQYQKTIKGTTFKVFDTAGLNDGMVETNDAFKELSRLVHQLQDGVSLLVYVMRGPRIVESAQKNYGMFYNGLCQKAVPIVILITGLEDEEDMDGWWAKNKHVFDRYKMKFNGQACITARKGKLVAEKHRAADEYAASKRKVEEVIFGTYLREAWMMEARSWVDVALNHLRETLGMVDDEGESIPNIIVFGEEGVGKSSLINMLEGGEPAQVSNRPGNVVFAASSYFRRIYGTTFKIFETVGLDEKAEKKTARNVIEELYKLIRSLECGVHLLVYVMRPRLTDAARKNYEMFFTIFCQSKVRIVVVITGLEEREDIDGWWAENTDKFSSNGMSFYQHACITAHPGRRTDESCVYEKEYEESKEKVEKLILDSYARKDAWKMPPKTWFNTVVVAVHNILFPVLRLGRKRLLKELCDSLRRYGERREVLAYSSPLYKVEQT